MPWQPIGRWIWRQVAMGTGGHWRGVANPSLSYLCLPCYPLTSPISLPRPPPFWNHPSVDALSPPYQPLSIKRHDNALQVSLFKLPLLSCLVPKFIVLRSAKPFAPWTKGPFLNLPFIIYVLLISHCHGDYLYDQCFSTRTLSATNPSRRIEKNREPIREESRL